MNGSLLCVAAQLMAAGHEVDLVDFNVDSLDDVRVKELFSGAKFIGISLVGSPGIPQAIKFCQYAAQTYPNAQLILGGQVIRKLSREEFRRIFGKRAIQATNHEDSVAVFGALASAFEVSFKPVWERMGNERLELYLKHEFSLVVSQGCIFDCLFCGADKDTPEIHRGLDLFKQDMEFLSAKAVEFGLSGLQAYASSLDFFQNPKTVGHYMQILGEVFAGKSVGFKMRVLSCMNTFLIAARTIPNFAKVVGQSGLWCVGFGVDGPDEEWWEQQHKLQNHAGDIPKCLNLCERLNLQTEILMVMAHPSNSLKQLWVTVKNSYRYAAGWPKVILRPYLAKALIPGNLGWQIFPVDIEKLINKPDLFYNLDFCALASPLTHPRLWHRWFANISYLAVIVGLTPFGRCCTSPLLPQGQGGLYGKIAKLFNRFMPFDR